MQWNANLFEVRTWNNFFPLMIEGPFVFLGSIIGDIFSAILDRLSPIISWRLQENIANKISPIMDKFLPILNIANNDIILAKYFVAGV